MNMPKRPLPLSLIGQWHASKNGDALASDFTSGSGAKVWWQCEHGHEWEAIIANRVKNPGCPYCTNRRILPGYNDLATRFPELTAQWHCIKNGSLSPHDIGSSYARKVWWVCAQGHEWQATVVNRSSNNAGCPVCSNTQVVPGVNDLATTHPALMDSWHISNSLTADQVSAGSQKKVMWQCPVDSSHTWVSMIKSRVSGSGCPHCGGRLITSGVNDLVTIHPDLLREWHPTKNLDLDPRSIAPSSNLRVWWQCQHGHEWRARPNDRNRTAHGGNCPRCVGFTSQQEEILGDWLESLGVIVERRVKKHTAPFELDLYLPESNLAVEFNGLYWHSEANGKDRLYHARKYQICASKGIQLLQIWEDDWRDRQSIIQEMILHRLGKSSQPIVYARNTVVTTLAYHDAATFLERTHIQGAARGSVYLGLRSNLTKEVVSVMVLRRMPDGIMILERYATSIRVPGGFTKLLAAAIRHMSPRKIITFADHCVSDGALYEKTGFVKTAELNPDYSYVVKNTRVHKFNYRLKRFFNDPDLLWQDGLTERQLAALNGLVRIWDAGKARYELTVLVHR